MAANTKIEWTDATWNPVTGCTRVSEGCRNCYAERLTATRLAQRPKCGGRPYTLIKPTRSVVARHRRMLHLRHPKGGDPAEWPADLRVREFPAGREGP